LLPFVAALVSLALSLLRHPYARQREFSMADYMSAMEGNNVVKTVFLETDCAKDQLEVEAGFVGKLCADPSVPVAGAVIGCAIDSPGFKAYIDKMKAESYVKGVRDVMHAKDKGFCLRPEVLANIQYLGECGLSCDICIQPDQLTDCAEMVRQCPGTTFISACAISPLLRLSRSSAASARSFAAVRQRDCCRRCCPLTSSLCRVCPLLITA
jgi:predicted TIM-barrel fold metal-dependent hydrolase